MKKKIEERVARVQRMKDILEEKSPKVERYVAEMIENEIKLSWDDLIELAIRFANEKEEEFYQFMRENYPAMRETPRYIAPSAIVVSTEVEPADACVAAVLGIGIGWVWAWLAVSPWAVASPPE